MYALSKSESNLGRGEETSERGVGERIPDSSDGVMGDVVMSSSS
jgi:hypothetical protein